MDMFIKSIINEKQIAFYYFFISYILLSFGILSYSLCFLNFSTPTINVEFHIHQSYKEIGLFEVAKLCARKMIESIPFMSQK